ncbi:MAG: hypothetical protein HY267_05300 [Deltaproteobacteria bacterium]|nr:hypothetical protein [Deltaproteobacteria bacterium]
MNLIRPLCRAALGKSPAKGNPERLYLLLWAWFFLLSSGPRSPAYSACGEEAGVTTQELIAEEQALRGTEQAVRTSRSRLQTADADLRNLLAHPSADIDQSLIRELATLRRTEVEPKRQTLENLRSQHEEARRQWERGHHLLYPQLAEAQVAFRAKTITNEEFCRVRETYQQALQLYLQGMQNYRRGLDLYAHALDVYVDRFLTPYSKGFSDSQQWKDLIAQLNRHDFLHEILIPMTANAVRSVPPDVPPE